LEELLAQRVPLSALGAAGWASERLASPSLLVRTRPPPSRRCMAVADLAALCVRVWQQRTQRGERGEEDGGGSGVDPFFAATETVDVEWALAATRRRTAQCVAALLERKDGGFDGEVEDFVAASTSDPSSTTIMPTPEPLRDLAARACGAAVTLLRALLRRPLGAEEGEFVRLAVGVEIWAVASPVARRALCEQLGWDADRLAADQHVRSAVQAVLVAGAGLEEVE
jgi:hypothetical protein